MISYRGNSASAIHPVNKLVIPGDIPYCHLRKKKDKFDDWQVHRCFFSSICCKVWEQHSKLIGNSQTLFSLPNKGSSWNRLQKELLFAFRPMTYSSKTMKPCLNLNLRWTVQMVKAKMNTPNNFLVIIIFLCEYKIRYFYGFICVMA